jgi:hypothetical protein
VLAHEQLKSANSILDLRIATSSARPDTGHVLILVHGLPRALGMGRQAAGLLPELAEHLANESGWIVATGTFWVVVPVHSRRPSGARTCAKSSIGSTRTTDGSHSRVSVLVARSPWPSRPRTNG